MFANFPLQTKVVKRVRAKRLADEKTYNEKYA